KLELMLAAIGREKLCHDLGERRRRAKQQRAPRRSTKTHRDYSPPVEPVVSKGFDTGGWLGQVDVRVEPWGVVRCDAGVAAAPFGDLFHRGIVTVRPVRENGVLADAGNGRESSIQEREANVGRALFRDRHGGSR